MKNVILALTVLVSTNVLASQVCDSEAMQNESDSMKTSAYWQTITQNFGDVLDKTYPRGCGESTNEPTIGLDMYMDDLEWVGPSGETRILARSGYYSVTEGAATRHSREVYSPEPRGSADGKTHFWMFSTDPNFHKPGVSEFTLLTEFGRLSLLVKTCSPKVALANLVAYAKYALNAGCGSTAQSGPEVGKAIEAHVQKILQNQNR